MSDFSPSNQAALQSNLEINVKKKVLSWSELDLSLSFIYFYRQSETAHLISSPMQTALNGVSASTKSLQ